MHAATSVSILSALAALGVILAIPHIYGILDLLWFHFLRPSSVKCYMHGGGAPYAIVTGATDGIGKATAAELLRRGFNLILHGRNEAKMQKVVEELGACAQRDIQYFIGDTSKDGHDWETLLALFRELHITVVVHNVGGEPLVDTRIDERPEEYLLGVVRSNAFFALFLTRALLPQLRRACHSGPVQVLLVGSFACDVGPPRLPMYAASKGFLRALARALSNDERFFGVGGVPSRVQFTYLSVGAVHSANHPAPMPPSLAVPTSARFAWWLVETVGCGRRHVVPYLVHALQYGLMRMSGERAVDEGMAERMRVLMERAAKRA
uniref:3-oxoacyl-reductase n=1 Tax=Ganoderma boninense TaxID=34458 RepID=A0A5K1JSN7_9APHY|nr:3-oxoacyl-reductase [Ganoderma boninense]